VVTAAWQGGTLELNAWPPPRPSATAVLHWSTQRTFEEGLRVESENREPADNPNHLLIRVVAPEGDRQVRGRGDVVYDPRIRLAATYLLWWESSENLPVTNTNRNTH
jgi:hypothetical protein